MLNIYGEYTPVLDKLLKQMTEQFTTLNQNYEKMHHERLYEHLRGRVKNEESMEEKCRQKGLPLTPNSALRETEIALDYVLSATLSMIFILVLLRLKNGTTLPW